MAADLQQRIRLSMLYWKLSVKTNNKKEDKFNDNVFKELKNLAENVFEKYAESSSEKQRHFQKIGNIWWLNATTRKSTSVFTEEYAPHPPAPPFICDFNIDI